MWAAGSSWAVVAALSTIFWSRLRACHVTRLFLSISSGWAGWAALLFVAGHLHVLRRETVLAAGLIGLVVTIRFGIRHRAKASQAAGDALQGSPVALSLIALCGAVSIVAAVTLEAGGDEVDYKWSAPLAWAAEDGFIELPTRLSNGWNLAEYLAIPGALWNDLAAARLNILALALTLALGAAALARQLGASRRVRWLVAGAVFTMPPVLLWSWQLGSDIPGAMFLIAALLALLLYRPDSLAVSLFVGAAMWTKVISLAVALPIMVLAVVLDEQSCRVRWPGVATASRRAMRLATPIVFLGVLGLAHTYVLTGTIWAPKVRTIYPSDHAFVAAGAAAGRIPDIVDLALIPVVPFAVGIIGQSEPYGARSGLVAFVGLLLLVVGWRRWATGDTAGLVLAVATASYLVVAPVFIKTRFLLFSYILWLAVAVVVIIGTTLQRRQGKRYPDIAFVGFAVLMWLSAIADPVRVLVRLIA